MYKKSWEIFTYMALDMNWSGFEAKGSKSAEIPRKSVMPQKCSTLPTGEYLRADERYLRWERRV